MRISGSVQERESGNGVAGIIVKVMDRDLLFDDLLGEAVSGPDGSFSVEVDDVHKVDLLDNKPDVYLVVRSPSGEVIQTGRDSARLDVDVDISLDVELPRAALVEAGLVEREPAAWMADLDPDQQRRFTTWTWNLQQDREDELTAALVQELAEKASVLELIQQYISDLKGNLDNNALPLKKLARLFELGLTPNKNLTGHYYGAPVGIRTGDLQGPAAGIGNILGFTWGITLEDRCPWVAKSFSPISSQQLEAAVGRADHGLDATAARVGINHFNRVNFQVDNLLAFQCLSWWMSLKPAPEGEREVYGHEHNGAHFISSCTNSVYSGTPREVVQLNYRHATLDNPPPNCWLIDELVQVAEGFYLGQLLYATRRLTSSYDVDAPAGDANYQHFGYFILVDESWNPEARRLLSHLDIPVLAPGIRDDASPSTITGGSVGAPSSTLTLMEPPPDRRDDGIMKDLLDDLQGHSTVLHLLKDYSDRLGEGLDNESPCFLRLRELFHRGIGPEQVEGFFRGALVSWHSDGLLQLMGVNAINMAYTRVGRHFSPWTGKSFESIDVGRLAELTDGHERGDVPTYWGSNTQSLRTPTARIVGKVMDLMGIWVEEVPPDEARVFGYDLKNFFFIGRQANSVHDYHAGKRIFQINYRWPKLKTIPPDCWCIDELVQVAEGLYLGQLMYATEILKSYDPQTDPAEYAYRNFGYFLLMSEAWHQVRLDLRFDLDNV